jgi:hypothetical protein
MLFVFGDVVCNFYSLNCVVRLVLLWCVFLFSVMCVFFRSSRYCTSCFFCVSLFVSRVVWFGILLLISMCDVFSFLLLAVCGFSNVACFLRSLVWYLSSPDGDVCFSSMTCSLFYFLSCPPCGSLSVICMYFLCNVWFDNPVIPSLRCVCFLWWVLCLLLPPPPVLCGLFFKTCGLFSLIFGFVFYLLLDAMCICFLCCVVCFLSPPAWMCL